jgi:hypothetical protein
MLYPTFFLNTLNFVNKNDKDWQNSLACAYVHMFVDLAMNPIDHPHGGKKYGETFCDTLLGLLTKRKKNS